MSKTSQAVLHPVCFGACQICGNEKRLHSHLGEGFSGDYGINKCRQYMFAQRFVWVTNCYAVKFILSYDGLNPAILQLQMRLMCWDVDIIHCNDHHLVDANYWSRLGVDLEYDPLYTQYLQQTRQFSASNPVTSELLMLPENMPYYRGPKVQHSSDEAAVEMIHIQSLLLSTVTTASTGNDSLCTMPVIFGSFPHCSLATAASFKTLYNSELASYALTASQFQWAVYNFSNGHFVSTIES